MSAMRDRYVIVDGVRHHYVEWMGEGQDIVLLHGFSASTYTWEAVGRELSRQGFHVWALDLKGFGWSGKPLNSRYDAFSLMEDVVEWMGVVGLEKAVIGGNSLGGGIASMLALIYPEKVSSLVLINPLVPYDDIPYPFLLKAARLPLAPRLARYVVTREVVKHNLRQVFYDPRKVTAEKLDAYCAPLRSPGCLHAQTLVARALDPLPFRKFLASASAIQAPGLIIWGENDRWIPLEFGLRLMREVAGNSAFVVFPECGHIPQEEKPRDTARCISDFLNGVPIVQVGDTPYCHVENNLNYDHLSAGRDEAKIGRKAA